MATSEQGAVILQLTKHSHCGTEGKNKEHACLELQKPLLWSASSNHTPSPGAGTAKGAGFGIRFSGAVSAETLDDSTLYLERIGGHIMYNDIPLSEFDDSQIAVIEPNKVIEPLADMPEHCVICFYKEVIDNLVEGGKARLLASDKTELGFHHIYKMDYKGKQIALLHPGICAPLASYLFEVVIAMGANRFIACGGAGVLNKEIAVGHLVIPSSAVRDEGTSFHYIPPSREIEADKEVIEIIKSTIEENKCNYIVGKTWTTDAIFRETYKKVQLRKAEGCLTVEMECAAFLAVAKFRGVRFGQILSGGDDVSSEEWDSRRAIDRKSIREKVFWIAVQACAKL